MTTETYEILLLVNKHSDKLEKEKKNFLKFYFTLSNLTVFNF